MVLRPTQGREAETWNWVTIRQFEPVPVTRELLDTLVDQGLVERKQTQGGSTRRWFSYRITQEGIQVVGKRQPQRYVSKHTGKVIWL